MTAPAERRLRVAYICQHIDVGGAEELIAAYVRRLPARGFDVATICLTRPGRIAKEIAAGTSPFWLVTGEPGPRDPGSFLRLLRLLRSLRPDIAHTFLLVASLYGRLAAIAAGVPIVIATEANMYSRKSLRHVWMERILARSTYRVIASSRAVQSFASAQMCIPPERMPVLYNAVDVAPLAQAPVRDVARRELGLQGDAAVIGSVARLTEQKGHRFLLDALPALAEQFPGFRLLVVGDGPLDGALRAQAAALGISDLVRFLGVRRDLPTIFAALDVFVLPSLWEGLPLSLLSAMAFGLPVVATSVGGTVEAVDDGVSGLLVPPRDADTLGGAVGSLLAQPELRARLGRGAQARARARFGLESHLDALSALYRSGLAEEKRA